MSYSACLALTPTSSTPTMTLAFSPVLQATTLTMLNAYLANCPVLPVYLSINAFPVAGSLS